MRGIVNAMLPPLIMEITSRCFFFPYSDFSSGKLVNQKAALNCHEWHI